MKKLTFLLAFALVFFYGCNKQETNPVAAEQQVDESGLSVWAYNLGDDNPSWELVQISEDQINSGSSTLKQSNSVHTHGSIEGIANWSGTENNGGPHGSAFFQMGPAEITMETECVMVEGNEAVYGGTITEVVNAFGPIAVGAHLYFKVIDNGQGNNAPPDQFVPVPLIVSAAGSACGVFTPDFFLWGIFGTVDVEHPDHVKVNS